MRRHVLTIVHFTRKGLRQRSSEILNRSLVDYIRLFPGASNALCLRLSGKPQSFSNTAMRFKRLNMGQ